MGIGVSKQAAAGSADNQNHHRMAIKETIHDVKPIISPLSSTTTPIGRNSNASFISTGFGTGGFDSSNQLLHHHHVRQPSVRRQFQPIPDRQELDQRFAKVLVSFLSIVVVVCKRVSSSRAQTVQVAYSRRRRKEEMVTAINRRIISFYSYGQRRSEKWGRVGAVWWATACWMHSRLGAYKEGSRERNCWGQ